MAHSLVRGSRPLLRTVSAGTHFIKRFHHDPSPFTYEESYERSLADPEGFWAEAAEKVCISLIRLQLLCSTSRCTSCNLPSSGHGADLLITSLYLGPCLADIMDEEADKDFRPEQRSLIQVVH